MVPDRTFKLHKLPSTLRHPSGVYRLVHAETRFHVSTGPSGRRTFSDVLRIGRSTNLLSRLDQYASFRSNVPDLDDFFLSHRGRIDVEVKFIPRGRLRPEVHKQRLSEHEARYIVSHATGKGRIPHFNHRGEFAPACDLAGKCFTPEQIEAFLLPWEDEELP